MNPVHAQVGICLQNRGLLKNTAIFKHAGHIPNLLKRDQQTLPTSFCVWSSPCSTTPPLFLLRFSQPTTKQEDKKNIKEQQKPTNVSPTKETTKPLRNDDYETNHCQAALFLHGCSNLPNAYPHKGTPQLPLFFFSSGGRVDFSPTVSSTFIDVSFCLLACAKMLGSMSAAFLAFTRFYLLWCFPMARFLTWNRLSSTCIQSLEALEVWSAAGCIAKICQDIWVWLTIWSSCWRKFRFFFFFKFLKTTFCCRAFSSPKG